MGSFAFKRQQRLLNSAEFTSVFNNVEAKISHNAFLILANRSSELPFPRLGLIAAKKNLKLAVQRNSFKRIVRESFRCQQDLPAAVNVIVMSRSGAGQISNAELRAALDNAWRRLVKRLPTLHTEAPPPQ